MKGIKANISQEMVDLLEKKYTAITGQKSPKFDTPEEYLQEICAYYENIIALLPNNVYWLDKNCILRGCNNNVAKLCNLPREKCIGLDYEQIGKVSGLKPEQIASFKHDDMEVMATGKPRLGIEELPLLDKDGTPLNCYISSRVPIRDKLGNVVGVIGISTDIIDRKRAEEYRIKHEAAQKVVKFSNLVAGSIAHELKNPLAGIRMQMQTLQNINLKKMPQQTTESLLKEMAAAIIKSVDATTYVIDGMLKKVRTFATGEVHHKEFEEISIVDDAENLLNTYPFEDGQQNLIRVVYNTRFNYLGDRVLTAHVLSNLMKNALHSIAQTDKTKANIIIETKSAADFNLLIFKDTATGIPKDFQDKIFDQFETKKDVHGGTGLGLAFCKSVMDSYGGSITCNSEEGKYTEFTLSFPKIKAKGGLQKISSKN